MRPEMLALYTGILFVLGIFRCQMRMRKYRRETIERREQNIIKINQLRYTAWTLIYYTLALATDFRSTPSHRFIRIGTKFKIHPMCPNTLTQNNTNNNNNIKHQRQ